MTQRNYKFCTVASVSSDRPNVMESQLGSFGLGPGDNKGILSLLTAIEQSEDNFDPG